MNTTLLNKPFLDYQSQIQKLKTKNLLIENDTNAIEILRKISYYGLINGYKACFKDNATHLFINGTTFDDIYNLYLLYRNIYLFFFEN